MLMETNHELRANPPKQLNVRELAQYLGVCERTIRNLVYERKVPFFRIGQRVLFRLEAIDRWIDEREELCK